MGGTLGVEVVPDAVEIWSNFQNQNGVPEITKKILLGGVISWI